jgi:hypothetical protein
MVNIYKGVFVLKGILMLFATVFLLAACSSDEEEKVVEKEEVAEEVITEEVAEETNTEEVASWQDKVTEIASLDGTTGEKFDAISLYAMDYPVTEEEMNTFLEDIIKEYQAGNYLADLENDEYMLTNLFKSQAVDEFFSEDDVNAKQSFAFDFWQNSKYTYRGVDAVDGDEVKFNETQMEKWLLELK